MKYAILSDIHGNRKHLKQVLSSIALHQVDHIYCLGDIFECKISEKKAADFTFSFLDQIVDEDEKLYKRMRYISCIIGNQEERIRSLVPLSFLDSKFRYFLTLPPAIELTHARLQHGHTFINEADWAPYPIYMTKHFLFFGHTHYSGLYQMKWTKMKWVPEKKQIIYGEAISLDPSLHWGINVGAVISKKPEWLLYEEEEHRITFFQEPSLL